MRSFTIDNFKLGLSTSKEPDKLKQGEASDILNWLPKDDSIVLSGGSSLVGTTTFTGSVTGVYWTTKNDGTVVGWQKIGAKLYAKDGSADWAEVGTDLFTSAASSDIASFAESKGITGSWVFVSSAKSGLWKLSVALPTAYVAYPSAGFKGDIAIIQNRLWVWGWPTTGGSLDVTGIQLSHQPPTALSSFNVVTAEAYATGNGVAVTFADTLDFKAGAATRNCFSVSITDGTETFTDTGLGTLSGSAGGTGTINYATGAASVTFAVAPANLQAITTSYIWEDSYAAAGYAKFSPISAAAGDGDSHYLSQPGVGEMKGAFAYGGSAFCIHSQGVYEVTFDVYGDPASNLVFRRTTGPSSKNAIAATADGIFYIDDASGIDVRLRVIRTVNSAGNLYVDNPSVSNDLDLSDYSFASASLAVKGDIVAIACASEATNDTVFVYDRQLGNFSRLRYPARLLATKGASLVFGDVALGATYTLLDGTLFTGEPTTNYWDSGDHDMGYDGLKRSRHLWAEGTIATDQTLIFYADCDGTGWSEVGRIAGTAAQVDDTATGVIGDDEIGAVEIGLYTSESAYPFSISFPWNIKYRRAKLRVRATGIGAASIDVLTAHDVRLCGSRLPLRNRTY